MDRFGVIEKRLAEIEAALKAHQVDEESVRLHADKILEFIESFSAAQPG